MSSVIMVEEYLCFAKCIPFGLAICTCENDCFVYVVTTESHCPALHIKGDEDNKTVGGGHPIPKK